MKAIMRGPGTWMVAAVLAIGSAVMPVKSAELTQAEAQALSRMTDSLNTLDRMSAKFVQVGPDGSLLEGRVFLQRPGKVRFEYNPPEATKVISDGFWVAVQDAKLNIMQRYPLAATPLKLILSRTVDLNRDARIVDVMTQPDFASVTLEARGNDALGRLTLMFDGESYDLKQWTVTDVQGLNTSVTLREINRPDAFPARMFRIIENRVLDVEN